MVYIAVKLSPYDDDELCGFIEIAGLDKDGRLCKS